MLNQLYIEYFCENLLCLINSSTWVICLKFSALFKIYRSLLNHLNISCTSTNHQSLSLLCLTTDSITPNLSNISLSLFSCQPAGGDSSQAWKYRTIPGWSSLAKARTSLFILSRDFSLLKNPQDWSTYFKTLKCFM